MILERLLALAIAGALSLGSAAFAQNSPGTSPYSVPKGGTGRSSFTAGCIPYGAGTAALACAAPGATSGVQPYDADLAALAGLTSANNKCFYWTGTGTAANYDCTSFGRGVSNAADATALRVLAGTVIGTDVQAYDADLAALAGLTSANNKCFYWTGTGTAANYDCTSFGRGVSNAADATALRVLAGTVIGTDVQAYDADLAALAANSTDGLWAHTGSGTGAARTLTAPAAGFTITNPAGIAGNPTFVLANDLAALEGLSSTGIARRTGTDAWSVGTLVTNAELAMMGNATFKCRTTAGTGAPEDCTATQSTALLNAMVGDSGSGGTKGLVPAPSSGDASAAKFLKADGTWAVPAGGGGGGMTDTERQNSLLGFIYQAKVYAEYRRLIGIFADGYAGSTGISSITSTSCSGSSSNCTFDSTNKRVYPTGGSNTLVSATCTTVGSLTGGGGLAAAFDGTTSQAQAAGAETPGGGASTSGYNNSAGCDWGSGQTKTIVEFEVYCPNDVACLGGGGGGTATTFKLQGSSDNSSYTDLYTSASSGSGANLHFDYTSGITTSTAYRYHRVNMNGNGTNTASFAEIKLYVAGSINNLTLVGGPTEAADSTASNGRLIITYDDACGSCNTLTLNTDLVASVSCNNGSNWASATLSSAGTGQNGRKIAESADTTCGANTGTTPKYKLVSANNKFFYIYGVAQSWH